ncbi:MAG TPA: DUF2721 domain-containing protein [Candidatus Thermoplasmatota archaeon]|nr:DUF2721 domain-containing protein [Candidatus Thermoplasmatota archaeon]
MAVPAAQVIEATLAPAFLISGASVFLNFAQNRLFRVMDRARDPAAAREAGGRPRLLGRARLLRNAIALGVLTVAFTVASAILVMAGQMFHAPSADHVAPYTFALALLSLFCALLLVLADTVVSVAMVERAGDT